MAKRAPRSKTKSEEVEEPLLYVKKNGRGRPSYEWTERGRQTFRDLVRDAMSLEDIAKYFRASLSWLEKEKRGNPDLQLDYEEMVAHRNLRLLRSMFKSAEGGNVVAQIWTSKQVLGWRDYRALELTGAEGGPLEVRSEVKPALEQKLEAFLRSKQNREAVQAVAGARGGRRGKGNGANGADGEDAA